MPHCSSHRFFGYRSFEPEYETMKTMAGLGIHEITLMVSNNTNFMGEPYTRFQPTWIWEREYDFTLFDKMVNETLEAVPDAKLNIVLDLNPPAWWLRRGKYRERYDPFKEFGRVAANQEYRDDVVHYLQAVLKHAIDAFPGRFLNFFIMGGFTTEWFDYSLGTESIPRRRAWDEWRKSHGKPLCDIPGYSERYSGVPESDGLLRTPEKNADALDYWKFNSEISLETVALFMKKAREVLPQDIKLGITYGYIFELNWAFSKASWCQLEYERLFDMPECDMALSPISYGVEARGMGGSPMAMIPLQTLRVRGKRICNSIDTTTFTSRFPKAPGQSGSVSIMGRRTPEWPTPEAVAAGLKREMCYNLIHGCCTWHFDMWGGWYDNDAARETLAACKRIWAVESDYSPADASEVVIVCDPENMYYINDSHPSCADFLTYVRKAVAFSGSTYTTASFNDLSRMDLSKVKLLVFCHPFDLDNGKYEMIERLSEGKTILWLYGPGVIHNGKWSPENVRRITGFPFGGTEIHYGNHSVYVPSPNVLTTKNMRDILRFAGAHFWTDKPYPVHANERLVSIHICEPGKTVLHFPAQCESITELFSGREYSQCDSIELETSGPETFLLKYN